MKLTRRKAIAGGLSAGLAVPLFAALAFRDRQGGAVEERLVFDPQLTSGRRFASAGERAGGTARAIEGDATRLAVEMLGSRPGLLAGISEWPAALAITEAAATFGYRPAMTLRGGDAGCSAFTENSQWLDLSHIVVGAQGNWAEAFARWAVDPALEPVAPATTAAILGRQAIASGWLLIKAD